ncbi:RDD family protein, partial [Microbacterium sp. SZ1]|uniref:RDD family protein n=1 Tax=Microbacterium sp. SZ1 TaxID=1849736 RepID=UPI00117F2E24
MTQPPSGGIAPISRRATAYLIDALIAGGIAVVLFGILTLASSLSGSLEASIGILLIGGPLVGLVVLGWFVFYTFMQAGNGSIGMRAQGLRLVSEDGSGLGFGRTLLRNIIFGLAAGIVVGYFTPLFDGSGRFQGWHDKVAKSLMLDTRGDGGSARPPHARATVAEPGPARAVGPTVPATPPQAYAPSAPVGAPAIPGIPAPPSAPQSYAAPQAPHYAAPQAPQYAAPQAPQDAAPQGYAS